MPVAGSLSSMLLPNRRPPSRQREWQRVQDGCAEMLAAVRRGPGSPPTDEELIEYLISRRRHDQERPPVETGSG